MNVLVVELSNGLARESGRSGLLKAHLFPGRANAIEFSDAVGE